MVHHQTVDKKYKHHCREDERKVSRKPKLEKKWSQLDRNFALKNSSHSDYSNKSQMINPKINEESLIKKKSNRTQIADNKVQEIVEEVLRKFSCHIENMCNKKIELFLQNFKQQIKKKKGERELAKSSNKVKDEIIIEILKRLGNEKPPSSGAIKKKRKSNDTIEIQNMNCEPKQVFFTSEISNKIPEKDTTSSNNNVNSSSKSSQKSTKPQLKDFSCQMMNQINTQKKFRHKKVRKTNSRKLIGFPASVSRKANLISLAEGSRSQTSSSEHLLQAIEKSSGVRKKAEPKPRSFLPGRLEKYSLPGPSKPTINHSKKLITLFPENLRNLQLECDALSILANFCRFAESNPTQFRNISHKILKEFSESSKRIEEQPDLKQLLFGSLKNQDPPTLLVPKDFSGLKNVNRELLKTSSTSLHIDKKCSTSVQQPYCPILASKNLDKCMKIDFQKARDIGGNDACYENEKFRLNKNIAETEIRKDVLKTQSEMCSNKYEKNQVFIKPVLSKDTVISKTTKKSRFRAFLDEQNIGKTSGHCQTEFEPNTDKSKEVDYSQDKICKLVTAIQERLHRSKKNLKTTETSVSTAFLKNSKSDRSSKSFAALYKTYEDLEEKFAKPEKIIIGSQTSGVISQIKKYQDMSVGGGPEEIFPIKKSQIPIRHFNTAALPPKPKTAPQQNEIKPARFKSSRPSTVRNDLWKNLKDVPQRSRLASRLGLEDTSPNKLLTKNDSITSEVSSYAKRKQYDRERREKLMQKTNLLLKINVNYMNVQNERSRRNLYDLELENLSSKFRTKPSNPDEITSALDEIEKCVNSCLNRLNNDLVVSTNITNK
ncbi:unnamed protein product [Ceutorhynchus assimilis]|uniref:Uncharacterized protein n=1 Tax=Ceutorhynchus assimilis TaxID=467358 RepID=A0A9N9QMQ0_9CUCU|nr:unnamed protein product [Ceutorhynchus assimilis]